MAAASPIASDASAGPSAVAVAAASVEPAKDGSKDKSSSAHKSKATPAKAAADSSSYGSSDNKYGEYGYGTDASQAKDTSYGKDSSYGHQKACYGSDCGMGVVAAQQTQECPAVAAVTKTQVVPTTVSTTVSKTMTVRAGCPGRCLRVSTHFARWRPLRSTAAASRIGADTLPRKPPPAPSPRQPFPFSGSLKRSSRSRAPSMLTLQLYYHDA